MDKMIIQKADGSLVDAQTSAKWTMMQMPGDDSEFGVALFGPHLGREAALHYGSEADCRAFLDALAVELGAVRWDGAKRRFVPVKESAGPDCPVRENLVIQQLVDALGQYHSVDDCRAEGRTVNCTACQALRMVMGL